MRTRVTVVGLGAGDLEQLPIGIYQQFKKTGQKIFVRTEDHPVIESLRAEHVTFESFDSLYEQYETFEDVYQAIVDRLEKEAESHDVLYAVPGHPMLAERTVQMLLEREKQHYGFEVDIKGGKSYLDDLFSALKIDPIEGFQFVDATRFKRGDLQYRNHLIFCQVYDEMIASEVKLALMEDLPHDYPVCIVHAAGSRDEWVKQVPLFQLDRDMPVSNLISVYVPPAENQLLNHQFQRLREVIAELRGPNGCPWDQKQTHESLKPYLIEEAYEVLEAIDDEDDDKIAEELGDVLLQIMLHSQIGEDDGYFSVDDVIRYITEKMIRRHPHVFGDVSAQTAEEVADNWEEIKKQEKGDSQESVLAGIAKSLPATLYAYELQAKAAKVGFDWDHPRPILEKIREELKEFQEAISNNKQQEAELEYGDVLFAAINLARYYKINPEIALQRTNRKFEERFQYIEEQISRSGRDWEDFSLNELDQFWERAKHLKKEHRGESE
ncbi:MAG: nucleoside triphosphate pyrophosphohydrolase [Bacillaceae bacterium]|nr:nucleoside triphosphate pyrophosphohydrolase [Bacillaceae bacterium]